MFLLLWRCNDSTFPQNIFATHHFIHKTLCHIHLNNGALLHQFVGRRPPRPTAYPLLLSPHPPPSSFISLASPAVRGWRLQMVEYQQQKGDPRGAQRPDSREPNMTWARQLFSTKLAWDERVTQLHAVNTIKEVFWRPLGLLQLNWPNS